MAEEEEERGKELLNAARANFSKFASFNFDKKDVQTAETASATNAASPV